MRLGIAKVIAGFDLWIEIETGGSGRRSYSDPYSTWCVSSEELCEKEKTIVMRHKQAITLILINHFIKYQKRQPNEKQVVDLGEYLHWLVDYIITEIILPH